MSACGFTGRPPRDSAVNNLVVSQRFQACQSRTLLQASVFANASAVPSVVVTLPLEEISRVVDGAAGTTTTWPDILPTANLSYTPSHGLMYAPDPTALGTLIQWSQILVPVSGVYSLRALVAQTINGGVYTVYIDGVATTSSIDLSAAVLGFAPTQWNGLSLSAGYHDLALINTAVGVNGNRTNLSVGGSEFILVKTA